MSGKDFLSGLSLDSDGRVVLPENILDSLNEFKEIVSAGGSNTDACQGTTNGSCSNTGNCTASNNTAQCNNTEFCGDTMNTRCPGATTLPGPGGS